MGNCSSQSSKSKRKLRNFYLDISIKQFIFVKLVGKGAFGEIWEVIHRSSKERLAVKKISKNRVISKKSVASIVNEMKLLVNLRSSFIVNIRYAFQNAKELFLALDFMPGGDLRYQLNNRVTPFTEEEVRFMIACILCGVEYIHSKGVVHRDIKPENLVFDAFGYLALTDFGISYVDHRDNASRTSGTLGYMAPEVICGRDHGNEADFFAIGVICCELTIGTRPYLGKSRGEIREAILASQAKIEDPSSRISSNAIDFINQMIIRDPRNRLGANGMQEIRDHPWFKEFKWNDLKDRVLRAPFVPNHGDNFDVKDVDRNWKDHYNSTKVDNKSNVFEGYYYDERVALGI